MPKGKIVVAAAALVAGMVWQMTSSTAAPNDEWLKLFVTANGGCQNRYIFAMYPVQHIQTEVARNNFNSALFGKPILKWTDDDIEAAVRVFQDCEMRIAAPKIAACMQAGKPQSFCETYGIDLKTPVRTFERYLRDTVTMARVRYAQQEAQHKAKIEQEKIEAENKRAQAQEEPRRKEQEVLEQARRDKQIAEFKRAQAQEEARRKEQQLLEQAQRDREIADEARRSAERDEPKIAEAIKQAEEARRARQEAEKRLAEIRGRSEEQQKQRHEELAQKRSVEREAELEERTSGYQRMSIETFLLDGGDLAAKAAKVSISGAYIREGNLSVLYADRGTAMKATRGHRQPNVLLLTDEASREFRQVLLTCQSNPASATVGCPVTILGQATKCQLSNAFGATRGEWCITVEKGWQ